MTDQSSEVQVTTPEDVLSSVLGVLEVAGTVYGRFDFPAPWGIRSDATDHAKFHLVARGGGWLIVDGVTDPIALAAGDLVFCQPGVAHTLVDRPETAALVSAAQIVNGRSCVAVRGPGAGARSTFICGSFRFPKEPTHPLFAFLPPIIHIDGSRGSSSDGFQSVMQIMITETASGQAGSNLIARRLSDILFIQILRAWKEGLSDGASWLKALREPRIAAVLALVHTDPGRAWTVDSLASEVALSRSTFSELFTGLVGEPPMRYVAHWRLQVAAHLLRQTDISLAEVAERVGYRSGPGFARVFSREFGVGPGAYRRDHESLAGDFAAAEMELVGA